MKPCSNYKTMITYVDPDQLTGFYERRQQALDEFLEVSGQTGAEKEYLHQIERKVEKPFHYEWVEGWSTLLGSMVADLGVVMALFLAVALSPLFAGVVMLISAAVKSNVLAPLLSLAVVYGPMIVTQYLPYGMQKALDLIPLAGSSTDIFRTNTFHIFGKYVWSPYLLITVPVLLGVLCVPLTVKRWSRRMRA